jgi:hypothetical protein
MCGSRVASRSDSVVVDHDIDLTPYIDALRVTSVAGFRVALLGVLAAAADGRSMPARAYVDASDGRAYSPDGRTHRALMASATPRRAAACRASSRAAIAQRLPSVSLQQTSDLRKRAARAIV